MDGWDARHDGEKVDLVFIVDCTGSMGSYIKHVQKHVQNIAETISRTAFNVKLALIEYRDHPPQDKSFVTKIHDFTDSVAQMKVWVDEMSADGGGDWAEAVADALDAATKLSYRKQATKMCVLIADAPPHGLDERGDGFPNGCPAGHDPFKACHTMAEKGITMYCIGCEPSVDTFRDLLIGLAHATGGQYVPLHNAQTLSKVIINAALEEVSLEKLVGYVTDYVELELQRMKTSKKRVSVDDLTKDLHKRLKLTNNRCQQLQINEKSLPAVTKNGRKYSRMKQMSQAKGFFNKHKKQDPGEFGSAGSEMVVLMAGLHVSEQQTEKLLMKVISRNPKIPVTHNEVTDQVEVGTIPEGV